MNRPSVLVVDDEPDNYDVIEALLIDCPYDLHYSPSGVNAIERLNIFKPDTILLDVMMPELDGIETCRIIKQHPVWKFTPIIIITALNSKEDLARCLAAGADDFVSKPVHRLELKARVNSMLRIKSQHDRLQFAVGEIQQAKDAVELVARAKADFLAMMSHEIRTPINGVLGMTQLLSTTQLTTEQQKYVSTAQVSGEMLLATIDDILDFSKIESGKLELEERPLELQVVLQDIADLLSPVATAKNLTLTHALAASVPECIVSDVTRLRQILVNLVNNAIKFTATGGVTIACEATLTPDNDYELQFAVSDTGIGIAAEDIDRLFQPFTQANISTTREYGGTGLGLVICRRLVEMMRGKIWIESELGRGATFHFTIRAAALDLHPTEPIDGAESLPLTPDRQSGETMPLRILLAEDDRINRELAMAMFDRLGYQPDLATNGVEAVAMAHRNIYDLVFLDLHMPKMDGIETARSLVSQWENLGLTYPRPRIIAMTANAMPGDREACLAAGMDDYISKPILMNVLAQTIEKWGSLLQPAVPPTTVADPAMPTIDLATLDRLRDISPALLDRLIPLFLNEEAPKLLTAIDAALSAGDLAQTIDAAHTLKGTSSALGALELARLCDRVETQAGRGDLDSIAVSIGQTRAEYHLVHQELSKIVPQHFLN
jgi:signal transduction histidine kinase/HPt (histidine-containing phosphotransfer) domain-containing protein